MLYSRGVSVLREIHRNCILVTLLAMSPLAIMDSADLVDTGLAWLRVLTCKFILDMPLTIMKG